MFTVIPNLEETSERNKFNILPNLFSDETACCHLSELCLIPSSSPKNLIRSDDSPYCSMFVWKQTAEQGWLQVYSSSKRVILEPFELFCIALNFYSSCQMIQK